MPNAIEMLKQDHRKVEELFKQFEETEDDNIKEQICEMTIQELETHATLEEEIFYPAAQPHVDEQELLDEAREEHHVVRLLLGELKKMSAGDERYDAKYKVLAESVKHHVEEEESELFPMVQDDLDAEALGEKMQARKEKLQRQATNGSGAKGRSAKSRSGKSAGERQTGGKKKSRRRAATGRR
ncbi:MAG: hemerythrin domain-containing protein [Candidatus Binatia bacterium]